MVAKTANELTIPDFKEGEVILIDKSAGKTSFDAIHRIRKVTGEKKVGHAGTLDPKASGLLIICTGKMTKEISSFQEMNKTYEGKITLGIRTPSMDSETEPIAVRDITGITEERILKVRDSFLGNSLQLPPMYSAVKYKGKSLYHYARKGKTVERKPRMIRVEDFEITGFELPHLYFRISCSKGTYIRVIADDLGEKLGCGAYLSGLRRISIGKFTVDQALEIEEFETRFRN